MLAPPTRLRLGGFPSITFTILLASATFPALSVTAYTISYAPTTEVSTGLSEAIAEVKSPSTSSIAVAPASIYVEPTTRVIGLFHTTVIAGGVVSTVSPVFRFVFVFPAASVTVIVLSLPSSPFSHTVHIHSTFPVASAGLGLHIIPGIVTVEPGSTHVSGSVTVVPV